MPLKKPVVTALSKFGMPASSWDGSSLALYKELMEFLSSTSMEDGSKRVPGTLLISTGAGRWQGKLKDPGARVYCFVTAETMEGLLEALQRVCETGEADWRADEQVNAWKGKK
jgi:hypothetical protein